MGADSKIEWTHHTFNPWWGCTRVSPGCENCYAETFDKRVSGKDGAHWGVKAERRFFGEKHWREPLKWDAAAAKAGERHRVFCASMADVFEDREELHQERLKLWAIIEATPNLDWMLLTKRPENFERFEPESWNKGWPRNVWAGCTVEDQKRADERIPHLLKVPAVVRFLSCEPLLGLVKITQYLPLPLAPGKQWRECVCAEIDPADRPCIVCDARNGVNLVIAGGESGHGARVMPPAWPRFLRDQCVAAGVAFHFKQWGQYTDAGLLVRKKHDAGRMLDGRTWDEMPSVSW